MLQRLLGTRRTALIAASGITVTVFAMLHGYQGWIGIVDAGLYGGLALTLLYLRRRRLTGCIVAHAVWNTLASAAIFLWF